MADITRIENEMYFLEKSSNVPVIKVEKIENNNLIWKVVFEGPESTPYEDGIFTLKLEFPQNYPAKGPEAFFLTKMFHPNITEDDRQFVCINILKEYNWKETRTVEDIILGIIEIMIFPTYVGGFSNSASNLLKEKKEDEYFDKVEEYTYKYAKHAL